MPGSEDREVRDGPERRLFRLGLGGPDADEAVDWEIEHYVEETVDSLVAAGWEPEAARREAERRFGTRRYGPRLRRLERRRAVMGTTARAWDFVRAGVRQTLRSARRRPGFATGVVVTLALGIGANAAMFGIIDRLLLRPPAHVVDHDEVRRIVIARDESFVGESMTFPDFTDFRAHDGFEAVAAHAYPRELTVGSGPDASRVTGLQVSHEFFPLLGAEPVLGRTFTAEEDRPEAPPTVVLGHEYWRSAVGGDRDVLGRTLELAGDPYTVIGVAPPDFTGVDLARIDVWLPIETSQALLNGNTDWKDGEYARYNWWMRAVGRLADDASLEAAESQATALHRNAREEHFETRYPYPDVRVSLRPLITARGEDASDESKVARWLGAVSLIVLLIACANVANLLLARAARRRREVAVRLALGVSRRIIVGLAAFEAALLGLAGGVGALALARWGGEGVRATLLPNVHFPGGAVDGRVVAFTLGVSLLAGLLAGLGPALQSTRADLAADLTDAGRGSSGSRSRTRSALVVAQATLSLLLLVGAGLFVRSLRQVHDVDLGLDADRVVLTQLELADDGLEAGERNRLYDEAIRRVRSVPGVVAAAATNSPFQFGYAQGIQVPGLDSIPRLPGGGPYYQTVTSDYFETVGLEIQLGRGVVESDGPGDRPVAVVSRTMADALWPGESPLEQCLMVGREPEGCTYVVGVVEDASRGSIETEPYMVYYMPVAQTEQALRGLYARAADDTDQVAAAVGGTLRSFSPEVRYATARTLRDILDPQARSWTLGATMFSVFGLLALLVASVGLYSVLSFEVAQRTREIGIRSALGAGRSRLLGSVMAEALRLVALGVVLGLGAAWVLAPRAGDLLFEVSPRDPAVLTGVAVVLLGAAFVAGAVPGLRATRVDPSVALRAD